MVFGLWPNKRQQTATNCSTPKCPNVAHTICLDSKTVFDCSEVRALRMTKGFPDSVVCEESATNAPSEDTVTRDSPTSHECEDLLELEPGDLVNTIRDLREELARKNIILTTFKQLSRLS